MSSADVLQARNWAADLIRWETSGPGDAGNAMSRVALRERVPFGKLWALKYRPPKEIASHLLRRIEAAHAAERERQLRKLSDETALTARLAGPDGRAVRAAAALLRAAGTDPLELAADVAPPALVPAAPSAPVVSADLNELPLFRAADPRP